MSTYYRPALLKEAVAALQRQTYENLEIILVNNGATPETVEYLHEVEAEDPRVRLVHFQENQFSWDDPMKMNDVCLNAALKVATGDYIFHQQDDDLIADDYAGKMVALFTGNPDCTTAAGLPVPIGIEGKVIDDGPRTANFRPRYMPGHLMALDLVRGRQTLFAAPGSIFTIRRDVLVAAGGYHRSMELSQLYGIVPFGVTGFDDTAILYWRYHSGQLNTQMSARGLIGTDETFAMLKEWEIERRWQVFGAPVAKEVVTRLEKRICNRAASWYIRLLYSGRFKGALKILRSVGNRHNFWLALPGSARQVRWLIAPFRPWAKSLSKTAFQLWPGLAGLSPRLAVLKKRVQR